MENDVFEKDNILVNIFAFIVWLIVDWISPKAVKMQEMMQWKKYQEKSWLVLEMFYIYYALGKQSNAL